MTESRKSSQTVRQPKHIQSITSRTARSHVTPAEALAIVRNLFPPAPPIVQPVRRLKAHALDEAGSIFVAVAGIERAGFAAYYSDRRRAVAIRITNATAVDTPLPLSAVAQRRPPQSVRYFYAAPESRHCWRAFAQALRVDDPEHRNSFRLTDRANDGVGWRL